MSIVTAIAQLRERTALYWMARTEKERTYLTVGGATVAGALVWMLFVDPAMSGIERLNKQLPELRQQAARMKALALEASELAAQPVPQATPITKESVSAGLSGRSLSPASLTVSGDYIKAQFNGVPFASLYGWLDAQRSENRVQVQDIAVTASTAPNAPAGQVDATMTLRQIAPEASR